ncbi:MAG TPA: hypothetical protein VLZ78_05305 [Terrimesophilobacter sp.]|nr:hypothetical protein [Terrimesophilobacter sp.]
MSQTTTQEPPAATIPEGATWTVAGVAVAIYVIAFFIGQNALGTDTLAVAWMTIAGMIAGVTIVPAIILTGIRHLVPALRR